MTDDQADDDRDWLADEAPTLSPFGDGEVDGDEHPGELRDRIRSELGLSTQQWALSVSVLTFLPYPIFVYLIWTGILDGIAFLVVTLAYSVVAMYINLSV